MLEPLFLYSWVTPWFVGLPKGEFTNRTLLTFPVEINGFADVIATISDERRGAQTCRPRTTPAPPRQPAHTGQNPSRPAVQSGIIPGNMARTTTTQARPALPQSPTTAPGWASPASQGWYADASGWRVSNPDCRALWW